MTKPAHINTFRQHTHDDADSGTVTANARVYFPLLGWGTVEEEEGDRFGGGLFVRGDDGKCYDLGEWGLASA